MFELLFLLWAFTVGILPLLLVFMVGILPLLWAFTVGILPWVIGIYIVLLIINAISEAL